MKQASRGGARFARAVWHGLGWSVGRGGLLSDRSASAAAHLDVRRIAARHRGRPAPDGAPALRRRCTAGRRCPKRTNALPGGVPSEHGCCQAAGLVERPAVGTRRRKSTPRWNAFTVDDLQMGLIRPAGVTTRRRPVLICGAAQLLQRTLHPAVLVYPSTAAQRRPASCRTAGFLVGCFFRGKAGEAPPQDACAAPPPPSGGTKFTVRKKRHSSSGSSRRACFCWESARCCAVPSVAGGKHYGNGGRAR